MQNLGRLKLMAVVFAVLWTAWMAWWTGRYDAVHILMLAISGSFAGLLWYAGMRWWQRRMEARGS
jgi:UDP-N-acetylmuramyl pentapeptide phosphotransferase/UDP-N-acetylglucosamine-1-phosphate transferase